MSKLKVGDKVRMSKFGKSEFRYATLDNPFDLTGTVLLDDGTSTYNIKVEWPNGYENFYKPEHLEKVEMDNGWKLNDGTRPEGKVRVLLADGTHESSADMWDWNPSTTDPIICWQHVEEEKPPFEVGDLVTTGRSVCWVKRMVKDSSGWAVYGDWLNNNGCLYKDSWNRSTNCCKLDV